MRTPSSWGFGRSAVLVATIVLAVSACGEAAPSVAPTVRPTPTATPNPHLADPTTADAVYRGLGSAGLRLTANNATAGDEEGDLVKRINATYLGWPLNVSEFRSSAALTDALVWEPGEPPGQGEAPVAIMGANVLVTWGPMTGEQPTVPEGTQLKALDDLVGALDRLLSPLRVRSVVAIDVPGVVLAPGHEASAGDTNEEATTPEP